MSYCDISPVRIVHEALRSRINGGHIAMAVVLVVVIGSTRSTGIGLGLLLNMFLFGMVLWDRQAHRSRFASATKVSNRRDRIAATDLLTGNRGSDDSTHPEHIIQMVDQVLARFPHMNEAKLIKARILYRLCGDRDGARCYCHDLLSQIRKDDPLLGDVCDLYLSTCRHPSLKPVVPTSRFPVEIPGDGRQLVSQGRKA
ncbi:MAG: hypothetical protein JJV98_09195 [Desulfosarcina sp.]|nr:hypothetical protein [Desulfobacterales bacterium]